MAIGILAFQGDVIEHVRTMQMLDCETKEVRSIHDLGAVDALIIPGGESTVIAKFMDQTGLHDRIIERCRCDNFPVYGTCAGAILLSANVRGEKCFQPMKMIDIDIERNAYGNQTESFEADLTVTINGGKETVHGIFIRSPKIVRVGRSVEVLASHQGSPVLVRDGKIFASTFHPELAHGKSPIHHLFLKYILS